MLTQIDMKDWEKPAAKKQDSGLKHSKPSRIAMPKRSMRFWKPRRAA